MNLIQIVPKKWLSYWVGVCVRKKYPFGLHTLIKNWFVKHYKVNVEEAEKSLDEYPTLGDFFIRKLKPGARPIHEAEFINPVDGVVTREGIFESDELLIPQVKDRNYSFQKFLKNYFKSEDFEGGFYSVIYLAPYNYHRIHSPLNGKISKVVHYPGELWPVNSWSVENIDGLFWRNERIAVEITSPMGTLLLVMVGATNVGRISLDFTPEILGNVPGQISDSSWSPHSPIPVEKGEGVGCFEMGSTVVLIGDSKLLGSLNFNPGPERKVAMGQKFGMDISSS